MNEVTSVGAAAFEGFHKIARLSRECVITEKIDGTNAQVYIGPAGDIIAGSRNRWLVPGQPDNHGFSKWVLEHTEELSALGPGRHFGEWWGQGIQRGYGLKEKRFSMFNVSRWCLFGTAPVDISGNPAVVKMQDVLPPCVGLVPVLFRGLFDTGAVDETLRKLGETGSMAAPGFMNPEGVVIYHVPGNVMFKKTLGGDGSKGE